MSEDQIEQPQLEQDEMLPEYGFAGKQGVHSKYHQVYPSLDGLPLELVGELVDLERLDDESLWQVMTSQVPQEQQSELNYLLDKNQAGTLTAQEREELNRLQGEADRVMLRKARAAVLLRLRGHRLPTLDELHKLTFPSGSG